MKKAKIVILSILSLALVAILSIAGTIAYLQSDAEDINVMTMGNVKIEQHEYERVVDANGKWIQSTTVDKYGYYPDELQEFTQAKPLYPAVYANTENTMIWDDRNGSQAASGAGSHQQSWGQIGASGSNQLFDDSVKNVQDKIVVVENTGKSDAYIRTWFAFEAGSLPEDALANDFPIHINYNNNQWSNINWMENIVIIDNTEFIVGYTTYLGPKSNPTGILAPGKVSYPSLLQVYLDPTATNETVENIDSNKNGTYDIFVFSQAVQTKGFDDANTALNAAFGTSHPWIPKTVSSIDWNDVQDAAEEKRVVIELTNDLDDEDQFIETENSNITINGNGNKIIAGTIQSDNTKGSYGLIIRDGIAVINDVDIETEGGGLSVLDGADVTFNGNSLYVNTSNTSSRYNFYVFDEGSKLTINGGTFSFSSTKNQRRAYIYAGEGTTTIVNGGIFGKASAKDGYTTGILGTGTVIIKGGTFGFDPTNWVADGYEAVKDGSNWIVQAK